VTVTPGLYKGASLVSLRQMLQLAAAEEPFLAALAPADRDHYRRLTATEWVPVELAGRLYAGAAPLLYPGQLGPVRLLGRDLARDHLRGIYRFVLRLMTVQFVADQTGRLWRMYNSRGSLVIERVAGDSLRMVLIDYPDYPAVVRESLAGYIAGTIELTGAVQVRVAIQEDDPTRYAFVTTWR
jgi:hypothetical protein